MLDDSFCIIQGKVTAGGINSTVTEVIPKDTGICVIALDTIALKGRTTEGVKQEVLNRFVKRLKI